MKHITVFCGSSKGDNAAFCRSAYNFGQCMAANNLHLVYGAAKVGVMGCLAEGALSAGGKVTGVIPRFLTSKEIVHEGLHRLIVVDNMHERKKEMNDLADGFVMLPGGFGTMEEFFEVLTWAQLGLHAKPIAILDVEGYFGELIAFFDTMVARGLLKETHRDMVLIGSKPKELIEMMVNYSAPEIPKWITDSRYV